jgi:hypothetical protein
MPSRERSKDSVKNPHREIRICTSRKKAVWRVPIGGKEFTEGGVSFICRATVKSVAGHQFYSKSFG